MKIKNYDRGEKNHNDKKLNDILSEDYRMLISGPSNCGKTNTLMHILREPLVYYDKCYIYTSNPQQDKIQDFIQLMRKIGKKLGYNPLEVADEDNIRDVKDYPVGNRKIVVFDDLQNAKDKIQNKIANHFTNGRHQQISPIYLAQSYYDIPKKLRLNCSHIILYPPDESNHRQLLSKEYRFNQNLFDKLDKYDFLFIDKEKKTLRKNFDEPISFS